MHLLDCIEGRCSPQLTLDRAAHVLRVIEAAVESSRTGRMVEIGP
jgi:predicted dehydrogenase